MNHFLEISNNKFFCFTCAGKFTLINKNKHLRTEKHFKGEEEMRMKMDNLLAKYPINH